MKKMKMAIVGTYEFGYERVQIVLREDDGGEFFAVPGDIDCPRIKIGADQTEWCDVVRVLMHEAMEFAFFRAGVRYSPSEDLSRNHAAYMFILDHQQLATAAAGVAELVTNCLPDLKKAWKAWKKESAAK